MVHTCNLVNGQSGWQMSYGSRLHSPTVLGPVCIRPDHLWTNTGQPSHHSEHLTSNIIYLQTQFSVNELTTV